MMTRMLWMALVVVAVTVPAGADGKAAALRAAFERRIDAAASGLDGVMGYAILDVETGDRFERLAQETFPTASAIKLAVLYELFRQADAGTLRLDDVRPLDRSAVVGGDGILKELSAPSMALRDYATLMIVLSDNTATNLVIDTVGMRNVTAATAALGLRGTRLRRVMMDGDAARGGDENVSTPAELVRLLDIIRRGEGLRETSRAAVVEILQKDRTSPLRRGVGAGVRVASKSGTLDGVAVDAGIVYLDGRPYILAAMTTYLADDAAGAAAIEALSREAFGYFSTLAASSEYGRRLR